MLPDQQFPDFSFCNTLHVQTGDPKWAFLELIDRGRFSESLQQAKSGDEWESIFAHAGLTVQSHKRHLSKPVVQIWDIGLRPLFPVLMRMTACLGENKAEIKSLW